MPEAVAQVSSRCIVVAVEGLDAVGKTTIAYGLKRMLVTSSIPAIVRHAEKHYLKGAFLIAREQTDPRVRYLLQASAAILMAHEIATTPVDTVFICDRYFVSARAYYLALCGTPDLVTSCCSLLPEPDLAILLESKTAARQARMIRRRIPPSTRKLRTLEPEFSARILNLILPEYPWIRLNADKLPRPEIVARLRDEVLRYHAAFRR